MNRYPLSSFPVAAVLIVAITGLFAPVQLNAANAVTGGVEGIVFNADNGRRLENARVSIEGTSIEAFSDADGQYRLTNIPAGPVTVQVFFTGLALQTETVTVPERATIEHDFTLTAQPKTGGTTTGPIKLSEYVVEESKEMDAAAIAINEQRFAPNIKTVVAADEFGPIVDDNVGEILKFLPGVQATMGEGAVRYVSVNGVPNTSVPVTVDGFDVSSAQSTNRAVDLIFASTVNLSRVEVIYSPTPEQPGSALAGSVNMVQRSAFERSKPSFTASAYLLTRDNAVDFDKTPGPGDERTRKIHPGFDFSYVAPVNKRLGFSLSGARATTYLPSLQAQPGWRGTRLATNGAALPDTTTEAPYLTDYGVRDFQAVTTRGSVGATLDFKLSDRDRIALSFKYVTYDADSRTRQLNFLVNRVLPGNFGPTFTHGSAGAGEINQVVTAFTRDSRAYMPTLTYRHNGQVWNAEAGLGYSHSNSHVTELSRGYFTTATARRSGVTVSFDDIRYQGPGRITVTDAAGVPVDPYHVDSFALTAATGRSHHDNGNWGDKTTDLKQTAFVKLGRDLDWRVPVSLRTGLDLRRSARDLRAGTTAYTFVGADGRSSTTPTAAGSDDAAVVVRDPNGSTRAAPMGFPRAEYISSEKLLALYQANPSYLTFDPSAAYRAGINQSKRAAEIVSSAYLRGDVQLFNGRLKLIGGVRAEQTNVDGEGPLTDATRNFQRDASGNVIRGSNGRPLPITTDPLQTVRLTLIDRGTQAKKEYLRLFPSLNAAYALRENLIARGAYYLSVGRPDFNQYAGGVTLPDTDAVPSSSNRIVVNNAGIKAWSARTAKVSLEYYFKRVGLISAGVFRREIENFFGATLRPATPDFLALYGLDAALYGPYDVATQINVPGTVRMDGVDVNYKQSLTFLPHWARGVQVFANGSLLRVTGGDSAANFDGFIPRTANWGVSLTRKSYNLKLNWSYRSVQRDGLVSAAGGRSVDPATYNWGIAQLKMELTAEYHLRQHASVFLNVRDLTSPPEGFRTYAPNTPDYARLNTYKTYGALWTVGVKTTF